MLQEPKIIPLDETHNNVLAAAQAAGVDTTPLYGALRSIYYGDTIYGYGPVAIIDTVGTNYIPEPHVTWFPWVSNRNKVKNFNGYIQIVRDNNTQIMIITSLAENKFYEHFVKRKQLRKIGHMIGVPEIKEVHFYQLEEKIDE